MSPIGSFLISFINLSMNCSLQDTIIFASPWSVLYSLLCRNVCMILFWQLAYFHDLCYYLTIKLKDFNVEVKDILRVGRNPRRIYKLLLEYNCICKEIHEYNKHWCKISFGNFTAFNVIICAVAYVLIYSPVGLLFTLIFGYAAFITFACYSFYMYSAVLIDSHSKQTNRLLIMYYYSVKRIHYRKLFKVRIKIIDIIFNHIAIYSNIKDRKSYSR